MTSIMKADNIAAVGGTGTITVASGNTLDASAGFIPAPDQILQTKIVRNSTRQTGTASTDINTISFTPKSSNSIITCFGVWQHGIGPASTNLDGWGNNFWFTKDGSIIGTVLRHDVWPGGFTVSYNYGPEWYINTVSLLETSTGHVAGTTYTFGQAISVDNPVNYWMINRPYAYNSQDRGTCSLQVTEIAQ